MATLQRMMPLASTTFDIESQRPSSDGSECSSSPRDESPIRSAHSTETYFNPSGLSRTNSIYTLSRASFSNQLAQLTSLHLPDASTLSSSVASIPAAATAATVLGYAAVQIQRWIQKAAEVLGGLDAEDDVEWAAAGGREGLTEVDGAIVKFETLVQVYVVAIEELQKREDISKVAREELKAVVDTMDVVLEAWENVRNLQKSVREQVELAMEWEELWNVVLGDIGLEMENLGRLVYEMEEKRHQIMTTESVSDAVLGLDMQELETIVEESPLGNASTSKASHRFSLPPAFPPSSPIESPSLPSPQDDSSLLALFARMQPLRASLDFLPMRLSNFQTRAEGILPTACDELKARRLNLEKKWKKLEHDAEALRRELAEDRWVIVFRQAGKQVQKMCESVERSISKLQEAIDLGAQHNNPPMLAKRIEAYEAKKTHYGPAIPRVLSMIDKGVNDRVTFNGEVLRLHADSRALWAALEAEIRDMDLSLDDLNMRKSQQLRDSVSSIVSNDISAAGSVLDTPNSSPASSVVMGPASGKKSFAATPELNPASRRNSSIASIASRPATARRNVSLQCSSPKSLSVKGSSSDLRGRSASSTTPSAATPTPSSRPKRPSPLASDKPRWNSSPRIDHGAFGPAHKSPSLTAPPPYSKSRSFHHTSTSHLPLPSPLNRNHTASPAPALHNPRSRLASGASSSLAVHTRRHTSPSPARPAPESADTPRARLSSQTSARNLPLHLSRHAGISADEPLLYGTDEGIPEPSPSVRPKLARPATAMASSGRRVSMLPVPKARAVSGRESVVGWRSGVELDRAWR
ncbi:hypothetical protein MMC34_005761 [Xylographa carneopallida]|nr:hypothetical protein [Xylographa carneopallida]